MKKLYSLTTLSLALTLLINGASAQTYTATYTAVRNGNWHVTSGTNVWDPSGEPPVNCINCSVVINSNVTVHLNTSVTLSGSSLLTIGSDNTNSTVLIIDPSTGATGFASANNIILLNDGATPVNTIKLANNLASVSATGLTTYDGILTESGTQYYKSVGSAPQGFSGNTVVYKGPASYGTSLTGPATLTADGTLPIVLLEFTATLNNKEVDLAWTTSLESNSDHYAIQRSADAGASWQVIGTVAAKGNSSVATNYSFTDANPPSGTSEYRLQAVDKDGKYTYSGIKTIRNGLIGSVSIFPNPAKDYVNITLGSSSTATGNLSIRLISQAGQLLVEKNVTNGGGTTVSLPVSSYPPGNYLIQVIGQDGTQQISKVLISRQ